MTDAELTSRAISKAKKSPCNYKVSAIGLNSRGRVIGTATNSPRFSHEGGGEHAEMKLMRKCPKTLHTIILCRVGGNGDVLPIDPCNTCQRVIDKRGIKIVSVR